MFSPEQLEAYNLFIQGHNIFITGPGGSGKSHLIQEIVKDSNRRFLNVYVTALTGFAALLLNCNARTLHSCTGIGLGNKDVDGLVRQIRANKRALTFWKTAQVFIVDEVSMLSALLFQKLNYIGQIIRKNTSPFGGIQVIFSGDFYQLPPIGNNNELATRQFCFQCEEWNEVFNPHHQIPLLKIFRQTDKVYAEILNQLRIGTIKKSSIKKLNSRLWTNILASFPDEAKNTFPTQIFPIRSMVDNINKTKLSEIDAPLIQYPMKRMVNLPVSETQKLPIHRVTNDDVQRELDYLSANLTCDELVGLKKGARVMIIINVTSNNDKLKLCNGSQGMVVDFSITDDGKYPIVQFDNGILETIKPHTWVSEKIPWIGILQLPLLLSWAITIHKSQGITLDKGDVDVGNRVFSNGQTYVALSRIKSLDGLYLKSFDVSKITINADAQQYYKTLELIHSSKTHTGNSQAMSSNNTLISNETNETNESAVLAPDLDIKSETDMLFNKFMCPK
jgi:ATP-dependent DNA helicase PIF1